MDFTQLDVFADAPFTGNPLAVFPEASSLTARQMQAIAREMNLSETTFVLSAKESSYDVRIFTPADELPFAGHPSLGTAWTLRRLGLIEGDEVVQRSPAGDTSIFVEGDLVWLERPGTAGPDLESTDPGIIDRIASAIGLGRDDVGLESREFGRSGRLRPGFAHAGLDQLMVPIGNVESLGRARPQPELIASIGVEGLYCFTAEAAGRLRARGFWPGFGIIEDPATGSAAAALGLYLADRVGDVDLEVAQGVEMGRPSRIHVRAGGGKVRVGGRCELVLEGRLATLPAS